MIAAAAGAGAHAQQKCHRQQHTLTKVLHLLTYKLLWAKIIAIFEDLILFNSWDPWIIYCFDRIVYKLMSV